MSVWIGLPFKCVQIKYADIFAMWQKGDLLNQPLEFKIKRDNDIVFINGNTNYEDGLAYWERWGF
ncbi:hypothetical protein N9W61_03365 [Algibacter sp.]|nr:hypothetical protein [Algibacter sp.]